MLVTSLIQAEIPETQDEIFAQVGPSVITVEEYKQALIRSSRDTFYHGNPPESELLAFQKDVAEQVIDRELLLQQATEQGLDIDNKNLEAELDKYRNRAQRHGQVIDEESETWQSVRLQIQQDLLSKQLEANIRQSVPLPSEDEMRAYYDAHRDKFTEPARYDLSTILLGVDPSSDSATWEAAHEEAQDLTHRLRTGADFAEMVHIHSSDVSASNDGELGYIHMGMFNSSAQAVIEQLKPGEISDPLQTLEGYVIFRLNDQQAEKLLPFLQVRERIQELWLRDKRDQHWQDYLKNLRNNTAIKINERYLTISGSDSDIPEHDD